MLKHNLFLKKFDENYFVAFNTIQPKGVFLLDKAIISQIKECSDYPHGIESSNHDLLKETGLLDTDNLYKSKQTNLDVWIHLTNECNLACDYCYVSKDSSEMSELIISKTFRSLQRVISINNFTNVSIKIAGGEPLLNIRNIEKCLDLVDRLKEKNIGKRININTTIISNGTLVSNKLTEIISHKGIDLIISLDGLEEVNDFRRKFPNGKGSFVIISDNIDNLLSIGIKPYISITVTNDNIEELPSLVKWLLKKEIIFGIGFVRENPKISKNLTPKNEKLIKYMSQVIDIIAENPPLWDFKNSILDKVKFNEPKDKPCLMGDSYIVYNQNGKVAKCQMLTDKTFASIDDKDVLTQLNSKSKNYIPNTSANKKIKCSECPWKYCCAGGCPVLSYYHYERTDRPSPYCEVYKKTHP